jgi:hypothetical protein
MSVTPKAPSPDDIRAAFVFPRLDTIVGEPTYKTLALAHTQCIRNATTTASRLGGGGHGHAGLVEFPDVYLLRTAQHFNRPAFPGDMPTYPPNADANQRKAILYAWQTQTSQYLTCQRIETILLSMLENTIEATYLTGIHDSAHGFGARNLINVFRYLFATYGSIGPDEILRNHQTMTTPVDANQPIAILFKQIEDCQKFAAAGQVAITPAQVLKAAETLILQTGKYTSAYREWIALDPTAKTYQNFKVRMTAEYQLQNTMTTTARDAGYHHANAAYNGPADEESLASAAQDFAAASAADSSAFATLTSTNGNLNTQLANMAIQNQQLQQQVADIQQHVMFLATAGPPPPYQRPPGRGGRGGRGRSHHNSRGQHRAPNPYQPGPPPYHPAPAPYNPAPGPPPYAMPPPPYHQATPQPPAPPYRAPQPPPGFQPNYQYQAPPGRGGYQAPNGYPAPGPYQPTRHQRPPNSKRYNNMNYCWTHGADIADSHRSDTCQHPAHYHQPQATRYNTMGGAQAGLQKTYQGS